MRSASSSPDTTTTTPPSNRWWLRAAWSGWAASVPIVLLATSVTLATPHARGIGFFPALRFAIVAPLTASLGIGAAFLLGALGARVERPRSSLAIGLGGLGMIVLGASLAGPHGLTTAALPVVLVVCAGLALIVPRFVERPPRSRVARVTIAFFGVLQGAGLLAALSTETAPPRGPGGLAFEVPRSLFDVEHKFIELRSGARIHYVDEGAGPTLLFLHGNPAWSFQWRDLIRALRSSYRCIALDYPGFGLSDAPPAFGFTPREQSAVVEEFVDRLQLRDVTLILQDWGGPIGLGFAGRRPELVRGVVLGATWTSPTTTDVPRGKFSMIAGGPVGEFAQVNFNALASFAVESSIVHPPSQEVVELYVRPFRPLDRRGIAAFYPGQIRAATDYFLEVEAKLPRLVAKPALIFWALQDQGGSSSDRQLFEAMFPNHKTVELPQASHFFFEDAEELTISEIRAFVPSDVATSGPRE